MNLDTWLAAILFLGETFFFILFFFKRTNLCNALVVQENSYSIANISLETIDTVQKIIRQTTATTTTNTYNVLKN